MYTALHRFMVFSYMQLYKSLRVRLVVAHVITWTSGDRINVVSDPNSLLNSMRGYKRSVTQPHDSLMFLTYVQIADCICIMYVHSYMYT